MSGETFLTRKGYEKLHDELAGLKERREQLVKDIGEAREKGDLKENAEYHAAKEESQKVLKRMDDIREKLRSARILEEAGVTTDEIRIGATVTLKDVKDGDEVTYTLVDPAEADFSRGRISVRSPLSEGLLGHKAGEQVLVKLPAGAVTYKVLKISRDLD